MPTQRETVTHLQNCGRQQILALELATSHALAYKLLVTHFGIGIPIYCYLSFSFAFSLFSFFLIYVKESVLLLLLFPYTIRVKCTMPKQV